eukprot:TRINITY_DN3805_c0_g1_i9.p1 TRINITY_DN3805_c0_g1~~TRINITY_DN3805_c0_g1_i9.p1  ORF type:complete len:141 (-),score=22.62 TRINITY_DN3805_c0_g1_i9:86-508(-)
MRLIRGENHLGIEANALHGYVAGWAPPEDRFLRLAPGLCEDDAAWRDAWGADCSWYQLHDPGCDRFADYGQRGFCRRACQTCARAGALKAEAPPPGSLATALGWSTSGAIGASSVTPLVALLALIPLAADLASDRATARS